MTKIQNAKLQKENFCVFFNQGDLVKIQAFNWQNTEQPGLPI
jgi:hypothetical protein